MGIARIARIIVVATKLNSIAFDSIAFANHVFFVLCVRARKYLV